MPTPAARSASSPPAASRSARTATAGCRCRAGAAITTGRATSRSTSCPQATNPASGHFVSANNKIVPDTYPYFISRDWDLPYRAERIEALLGGDAAAVARGQRGDPGRHAVARWRKQPGAADDQDRAVERHGARGRRPAAQLGFAHGRATRSSRCCSPPGCASCPLDPVSPGSATAAADYWDLQPDGHARRPDPAPRLVRRPEEPGRDLRDAVVAGARHRARRAAPRATATRWRNGDGAAPMSPISPTPCSSACRCCATGCA